MAFVANWKAHTQTSNVDSEEKCVNVSLGNALGNIVFFPTFWVSLFVWIHFPDDRKTIIMTLDKMLIDEYMILSETWRGHRGTLQRIACSCFWPSGRGPTSRPASSAPRSTEPVGNKYKMERIQRVVPNLLEIRKYKYSNTMMSRKRCKKSNTGWFNWQLHVFCNDF